MDTAPQCPLCRSDVENKKDTTIEPRVETLTHSETMKLVGQCGLFAVIQVHQDITAKIFHCNKLYFVQANHVSWIGEQVENTRVSFTCLKCLLLKLKANKKARRE